MLLSIIYIKGQAFFMFPFLTTLFNFLPIFFHRVFPNTFLSVVTSPDFQNSTPTGVKGVKMKKIKSCTRAKPGYSASIIIYYRIIRILSWDPSRGSAFVVDPF